jgi:predicted nucleotidyltransferase
MNALFAQKLYHKTPLRILSFLSLHPTEIFSAKEIADNIKASKGATNQALRLFLTMAIVSREKKGNTFLYRLNFDNIILKQFKIFEVLLGIQNLIKDIMPYCYQIILFGSCANGSNTEKSDIDLFVKTDQKRKVQKFINKYKTTNLKIQAVILDPLEIAASKKEDKPFYEQVKKGIVLWEGKPAHEEF